VRRSGGVLPAESAYDSEDDSDSDPEIRITKGWRRDVLDRLMVCDNKEAATIAMQALSRADSVKARSKNLQGPLAYDLRVSVAVARHACLRACQ